MLFFASFFTMCVLFCIGRNGKRLAGFRLNANLDKSESEAKYKDWAGLLFDAYKELNPKSDAFVLKDENAQYDAAKKRNNKKRGILCCTGI